MAVAICSNSPRMRLSLILRAAWAVRPTTKLANKAMMPITTSSSISVKPEGCAGEAEGLVADRPSHLPGRLLKLVRSLFIMIRGRSGSPFTQFLFHSFAQPLFNHALVVQETRPRQPFDPRQHPRVDSQCDRHRFRRLRRGHTRGFHQPQVRTVFGPKRRFGLFAVEKRNFFPVRDGVHVRLWLCAAWRSFVPPGCALYFKAGGCVF